MMMSVGSSSLSLFTSPLPASSLANYSLECSQLPPVCPPCQLFSCPYREFDVQYIDHTFRMCGGH